MTRTNRQEAVQGRIGRLTHTRLARAIGVAAVLILMMMLFVTTGSAQYAEQGAIRLSAGQAGGDLSAYLISLYCTEGSGYLTVLTAGDQDSLLSGTEEGSSIIASAEGSLTLIKGGGAASQDEQEVVGEYNGEIQLRGALRITR